jgi:hypothetical protein
MWRPEPPFGLHFHSGLSSVAGSDCAEDEPSLAVVLPRVLCVRVRVTIRFSRPDALEVRTHQEATCRSSCSGLTTTPCRHVSHSVSTYAIPLPDVAKLHPGAAFGYPVAGLEFGQQCFCGDKKDITGGTATLVAEDQCTQPCSGLSFLLAARHEAHTDRRGSGSHLR